MSACPHARARRGAPRGADRRRRARVRARRPARHPGGAHRAPRGRGAAVRVHAVRQQARAVPRCAGAQLRADRRRLRARRRRLPRGARARRLRGRPGGDGEGLQGAARQRPRLPDAPAPVLRRLRRRGGARPRAPPLRRARRPRAASSPAPRTSGSTTSSGTAWRSTSPRRSASRTSRAAARGSSRSSPRGRPPADAPALPMGPRPVREAGEGRLTVRWSASARHRGSARACPTIGTGHVRLRLKPRRRSPKTQQPRAGSHRRAGGAGGARHAVRRLQPRKGRGQLDLRLRSRAFDRRDRALRARRGRAHALRRAALRPSAGSPPRGALSPLHRRGPVAVAAAR